MAAWRIAASGRLKGSVMPVGHQLDRALWRGLESTLRTVTRPDSAAQEKEHGAAPSMATQEWLAGLVEAGVLDPSTPTHLHSLGLVYGSKNSDVVGAIDDRLTLAAGILSDAGLLSVVKAVLAETGRAVSSVGFLASDLALAAGADGDPVDAARPPARELAYARLDPAFRHWVGNLRLGEDPFEARDAGRGTAYRLLLALGEELVMRAGPDAATGRFVASSRDATPELLDGAVAEAKFRRAVRKALSMPAPSQPSSTQASGGRDD